MEIRSAQARHEVVSRSKREIREKVERLERRARPPEPEGFRPRLGQDELVPGKWVTVSSLGRKGRIIDVQGGARVLVELPGGMRVETRVGDLERADGPARRAAKPRVSYDASAEGPVETELMIRGLEREEAMEKVDAFIDRAVLHGVGTVRVIHGIGRGILRKAVYEMLRNDPRVAEVHPGEPAVGGDGVAVVKLK